MLLKLMMTVMMMMHDTNTSTVSEQLDDPWVSRNCNAYSYDDDDECYDDDDATLARALAIVMAMAVLMMILAMMMQIWMMMIFTMTMTMVVVIQLAMTAGLVHRNVVWTHAPTRIAQGCLGVPAARQ